MSWCSGVTTRCLLLLLLLLRCVCPLQERRVSCVGLGWLSGFVVACSCSPLTGSSDAASSAAAAAAASAAAAAAAVAAAAGSGVDLSRGLGAGFKCQLLLFPRGHLDLSAVAASYTLSKVRADTRCRCLGRQCWPSNAAELAALADAVLCVK